MADIEKVIKGWERCLECEKAPIGLSQAYVDCEYTIGLYCGRDKLIWETIRLLKEQQPRVLSKREAYDLPNETDVWCEQRDSKRVAAMTTLGKKYFMHTPMFAMGLESNDIRFWTKRPTEEQRKAVPWETH